MGRPPCCDKVGIKKGPWTPEEDIILVSYIQEHGPGNWRSVPTNTGLLRCSKSCRLRWTNYLRPGIKRGHFTPHEEGMIIHLQGLLGNKWAAIASYLPQRTDNDIKNYWNTHLKKKIKKFQTTIDSNMTSSDSSTTSHQLTSKGGYNSETIKNSNITTSHSPPLRFNQSSSTYASSTENISKLLEGWMKSPPKDTPPKPAQDKQLQSIINNNSRSTNYTSVVAIGDKGCAPISHEELESFLSFENLNGIAWEKSSADSMLHGSQSKLAHEGETKQKLESHQPPLSLLEKWLLDEATGQVDELMELSNGCCSNAILF